MRALAHLLHVGQESSDVLNRARILDSEAVALTLHAALVDQHTGISVEAGKGQSEVLVKQADLADCAGILWGKGGKDVADEKWEVRTKWWAKSRAYKATVNTTRQQSQLREKGSLLWLHVAAIASRL